MNKNTVYLRRRNKVLLNQGTDDLGKGYIATMLKNLSSLGYTMSPELIAAVNSLSFEKAEKFYADMVTDLKKMVGAHRKFDPMYPNFPKQVMEASDAELYINAIMHYLGDTLGMRILPEYEKMDRVHLKDVTDLKVIKLGDKQDFVKIFRNLMLANSSISGTDKSDLEWFVDTRTSDSIREALITDELIPYKENLTYMCGLFESHPDIKDDFIRKHLRTATDVLRYAVALSDGDVSLAENTKFINFKRTKRRYLLSIMEGLGSVTEDMLRHKSTWKRLGERLHPSEYAARYPRTAESFDILRNNKPFYTFNSKVEQALLNSSSRALDLLESRPGDLARRLDHLLRKGDNHANIAEVFDRVASKVSTPVLLQVMNHFEHRNSLKHRVVFPKGSIARASIIEGNLPAIDQKWCDAIRASCVEALVSRFAAGEKLGKVYVDKDLRNYLVPFSQRSASKSLRTVSRGSSMAIPAGETLRFFLWWKDIDTSIVDVDLSSVAFNDKWGYKGHVSYTNGRISEYQAYFSGDITSAPNGACEFIDMHIPSMVEAGCRYVVMNVLSYTRQPFSDMPECYAGWMMRQAPNSGEIFEPKTVQDKIDITAETTVVIPVIIDLVDRRVIWSDIALKSMPSYVNNIESNLTGIALAGFSMTNLKKPDLYELFVMHAAARGTLVDTKEEADTIFSVDEGVTPFDIETIMGEYMG